MFLPSPKQKWTKFIIIYFIFLVEIIRHRYEYQKILMKLGCALKWYKKCTSR